MAPAGRPGRRGVRGRHGLGRLIGIDRRIVALKRVDEFLDRTLAKLFFRPIHLGPLDPLKAAGIGLDHRGVHGKALAADQPRRHATADNLLEHLAQDIAVAKAAVAVHREGRMMGNLVLQTQAAEPAVGQVHLHLLAQAPLRADRIAVADQQHPHHQLGTDRRAAQVAVMGPHLAAQPAQVQNRIDPPQQMIGRNHVLEIEFIEKTVLPTNSLTHHRFDPPASSSQAGNHSNPSRTKHLFNTLG